MIVPSCGRGLCRPRGPLGRQQAGLAEEPQNPFAADLDAVFTAQPSPDLAIALAGERRVDGYLGRFAGGIWSPLVSAAARSTSFSMAGLADLALGLLQRPIIRSPVSPLALHPCLSGVQPNRERWRVYVEHYNRHRPHRSLVP
jgi:hypothetical protein